MSTQEHEVQALADFLNNKPHATLDNAREALVSYLERNNGHAVALPFEHFGEESIKKTIKIPKYRLKVIDNLAEKFGWHAGTRNGLNASLSVLNAAIMDKRGGVSFDDIMSGEPKPQAPKPQVPPTPFDPDTPPDGEENGLFNWKMLDQIVHKRVRSELDFGIRKEFNDVVRTLTDQKDQIDSQVTYTNNAIKLFAEKLDRPYLDRVGEDLDRRIAEAISTHIKQIDLGRKADIVIYNKNTMHAQIEPLLLILMAGENALLVGPAGCGKTTLAKQASEMLNIEFYFTGAISSEFKLLGYNDATGRYIPTQFYDAFTKGGLFLFDEIDASDPQALLAFNTALANEYMDFPNGKHQKHPDFRCVAAANTWGHGATREYVGRSQLDGATLDRFCPLWLDYDESMERQLLPETYLPWIELVWACRNAAKRNGMKHIISTRAIIRGGKLLALGMSPKVVFETVILKGATPDYRRHLEAEFSAVASQVLFAEAA